MTGDRDPEVGALLDRLPVDPPGDRFWADLTTRLRAESPSPLLRVVPALPEDEAVELRSLRHRPLTPRAQRRRRLVTGLVAAALAVGAVLGIGVLQDDGPDRVDVVPIDPNPTDASTTTPTTEAPLLSAPAERAIEVAQAWVDAAGRGDAAAAYALLGPQSLEMLGDDAVEPAFVELFGSGLAEQWAPSDTELDDTLTPIRLGQVGPDDLWVVAVNAAVPTGAQRDRLPPPRAVAVRIGADGARVEPLVPGPALGIVVEPPDASGVVSPQESGVIRLAVDRDAAAVLAAVDGAPVEDTQLLKEGVRGSLDGVFVTGSEPYPDTSLHTLIVAFATPEGAIALVSTYFDRVL